MGQTASVTTTYFALDVMGLPEVIYTTEDNLYLHLPGVMMAESGTGEIRYLLSDGLGSVRQATDESGEVVAYNEFDPYGNPIDNNGGDPYGYTGEWWESDINLLHLRARWYLPETGTFLSVDPVESEPPYQYVRSNPINKVDPWGMQGGPFKPYPEECMIPVRNGDIRPLICYDYPPVPDECLKVKAGDIYPPTCYPPFFPYTLPSVPPQQDWPHIIETIFESLAKVEPNIFRRAPSGALPVNVPTSSLWTGVESAATVCSLTTDVVVTSWSLTGLIAEGVASVGGSALGPEGGAAAGYVTYQVAFNPIENLGSAVGACCSVAGEWAGGKGQFVDNGEFVVGQDAMVVASTLAAGNMRIQAGPLTIALEGVGDTVVNGIQLWYDANRTAGNVPTFIQGRAKMLPGPIPIPGFWPVGVNSYISVFDIDAQPGWWQR